MTVVGHDASLKKPGAAVEQVIHLIVERIATGEFLPGEQLRQGSLAELLGTSRVPVREALHALAEQYVLTHVKHRGFFVAKRTPSELSQLSRLIAMIEDEVLRSIQWPDETQLESLRDLNRQMLDVADEYESGNTFLLNREFHFTIFRLSPLTFMTDELERLWRLAQPYIVAQMYTPEARRMRVAEHEEIIRKLEAHEMDALVSSMRSHRRHSG